MTFGLSRAQKTENNEGKKQSVINNGICVGCGDFQEKRKREDCPPAVLFGDARDAPNIGGEPNFIANLD